MGMGDLNIHLLNGAGVGIMIPVPAGTRSEITILPLYIYIYIYIYTIQSLVLDDLFLSPYSSHSRCPPFAFFFLQFFPVAPLFAFFFQQFKTHTAFFPAVDSRCLCLAPPPDVRPSSQIASSPRASASTTTFVHCPRSCHHHEPLPLPPYFDVPDIGRRRQ